MEMVETLTAGVIGKQEFGRDAKGRIYIFGSDKKWHEVADKNLVMQVRDQLNRASAKK